MAIQFLALIHENMHTSNTEEVRTHKTYMQVTEEVIIVYTYISLCACIYINNTEKRDYKFEKRTRKKACMGGFGEGKNNLVIKLKSETKTLKEEWIRKISNEKY